MPAPSLNDTISDVATLEEVARRAAPLQHIRVVLLGSVATSLFAVAAAGYLVAACGGLGTGRALRGMLGLIGLSAVALGVGFWAIARLQAELPQSLPGGKED